MNTKDQHSLVDCVCIWKNRREWTIICVWPGLLKDAEVVGGFPNNFYITFAEQLDFLNICVGFATLNDCSQFFRIALDFLRNRIL